MTLVHVYVCTEMMMILLLFLQKKKI
jgi:hypothetical protein